MSYFLDTNICIYALKGEFAAIATRMNMLSPHEIKIPTMVAAELRLGAEKSNQAERVHAALDRFLSPFELVPFDADCVSPYAAIRHQLEARGELVGPNDLVIAATVAGHGGVLVTHNTREFARVDGLLIDDWTTSPQG